MLLLKLIARNTVVSTKNYIDLADYECTWCLHLSPEKQDNLGQYSVLCEKGYFFYASASPITIKEELCLYKEGCRDFCLQSI